MVYVYLLTFMNNVIHELKLGLELGENQVLKSIRNGLAKHYFNQNIPNKSQNHPNQLVYHYAKYHFAKMLL